MEIKKVQDGDTVTLTVDERLDIATSPILEKAIQSLGPDVMNLVLEFSKLDYISSAGIRVVLMSMQMMTGRQGKITIVGANKQVRDVFALTGLDSYLTFA